MIIRNVPVRLLDICIANLPSTVSYAPWKWIDQVGVPNLLQDVVV